MNEPSFWETGSFIGQTSSPLAGFAADMLFWDAVRDVPTTGMSFMGKGQLGFQNFWTSNAAGKAFAKETLGMSGETYAAKINQRVSLAAKPSRAGMAMERTLMKTRFNWAPNAVASGGQAGGAYGEARLATRMARPWTAARAAWTGGGNKLTGQAASWGVRAMGMAGLASSAATGVFAMAFSAPAVGFSLGAGVTKLATNWFIEKGQQEVSRMTRVDMAPAFYDTSAAATMRQAAMQEIQNTQLNLRSAFGNEASTLHR